MSKRELLLKIFHNEPAEHVPVGFWFHYAKNELEDVFVNPRLRDINLEGHKKFFTEFQPDLLKIMTDGYFCYPNEIFNTAEDASALREVHSIGADHPWIREQVKFAKSITSAYGSEVLTFYNIFAPATLFKFARSGKVNNPDALLADFIIKDRAAVLHALQTVAGDIALLARAVISEGGADGIYFSAQDVTDPRIDERLYREVIMPGDLAVLESANKAGQLNILHICSYAGHHNDITHYKDYPAQIINWAAFLEKVPLGAGKKIFGGKPVIGGFDNTVNGVLYKGSEEEIEAETARLLEESGRQGVVLGADCTIPRDISLEHIKWVREKATGNPR
jgi:uroporphyrinogen decarboxylase